MKNSILKITSLSLLASSLLFASGWRIPETSAKSIALSGANIANSSGPTTTYDNPANMSFNKDTFEIQADLTLVKLSKIKYQDKDNNTSLNSDSLLENIPFASMFFTSKAYGKIRYGMSLTVPGGLSKRWDDPYAKTSAEEFTLKIVELNPTVSYLVSNNLSIATGFRIIYSEGIVKSDGTEFGKPAIRDMQGNTMSYGYNLALSYKYNDKSNIALTYRSNIDLKEEGNAKLYLSGTKVYDGGSSVTVPLPAVLSIAYSYDILEKTNVEFEFDKTYWSVYKNLDFEYTSQIPLALRASFDDPKTRNWKDTNALRIGVTHKYSNKLILMFGFAKDKNPAPTKRIGFELPDSDATLYSFGFDYKLDNKSNIGFGYLYDKKDARKVSDNDNDINGEFTDASAQLISLSYRMKF